MTLRPEEEAAIMEIVTAAAKMKAIQDAMTAWSPEEREDVQNVPRIENLHLAIGETIAAYRKFERIAQRALGPEVLGEKTEGLVEDHRFQGLPGGFCTVYIPLGAGAGAPCGKVQRSHRDMGLPARR